VGSYCDSMYASMSSSGSLARTLYMSSLPPASSSLPSKNSMRCLSILSASLYFGML